jgi:allophanate hydrolase subunit 1
MKIEIAGHDAFIVYFADEASAEVSALIQAAVNNLKTQMSELLVDLVPSYASLLVIYDINICDHFEAMKRLKLALSDLNTVDTTSAGLCCAWLNLVEERLGR